MDFSSRCAEVQHHHHHQHSTTNPLYSDPFYAQIYNAPQHPHHPQSYAPHAYFHSPNPNLNPNPDSGVTDTGLRPPGVESYAPNPYAPHGGYVVGAASSAQYGHPQQPEATATAYFHDPNPQQQDWGAADPVGYAAMAGANPSPMVWNDQRIHPFAGGINMKKNLKKTKVVQSAWCELCKIDCNSQDILNNHRLGKKHMKNLRKLVESKNVVTTEPVATMVPQQPTLIKEIPSGEGAQGKKMKMKQISASKPEEDIETKRRKLMEGGTAADSLRVCTVCNVVCNSETVFHLHLAGQKHAAKVASAPERKEPMIGPIPNPNPNQIQIQNPLICNDKSSLPTFNGGLGKKKKKSKTSEVMRPLRCELCQIDCSSQDILNRHNVGKRHNKNLEKVELWKNKAVAAAAVVTPTPTAFAATASMVTPNTVTATASVVTPNPTAFAAAAATTVNPNPTAAVVNPNSEAGMKTVPEEAKEKTARGKAKRKKLASTFRPGEDLETKKRKLLECGTTADSVKVCTVCNVVCNSETVYRYHLAGQKHATLLKKQMMKQSPATATSAVGPLLITSTIATVGPQPPIAVTATAPVGPHQVTAATVAPTAGP